MSKAIRKLAPLDPIANTAVSGSAKGLVDPTASIKSEKAKEAEKAAAAAAATGAPSVAGATKARGMDERQGRIEAAAYAAGAARGDNEADVLGRDNFAVKRKRASKDLLG